MMHFSTTIHISVKIVIPIRIMVWGLDKGDRQIYINNERCSLIKNSLLSQTLYAWEDL